MKQDNKKVLKWLGIGFGTIIFILLIPLFVLYSDSCRNYVLNYAIKHIQSENLSLKIEGLNKDLTRIDRVSVRFQENIVDVSEINLKRNGFLSSVDISINKIIYTAKEEKPQEKIQKEKEKSVSDLKVSSEEGFDLNTSLFYVKQIKRFIRSLKVSELIIVKGKDKQIYKNLSYLAEDEKDRFSMNMDKSKLNAILDWNDQIYLKGEFVNIEGYSGTILINSLLSATPNYDVFVKNSDFNVKVQGTLENKMDKVVVSKGSFDYGGKKLNFWGDFIISKKKAHVLSKISLSDFIDISKIPADLTKNFQNILVDSVVQLGERNRIDANANLSRDGKKLGSCYVVSQGKSLSVKADVSWISIKGYVLQTLVVKTPNMKDFNVDIEGSGFNIHAEAGYGKNLVLRKAVIDIKKGKIVLDKPVVLDGSNLDLSSSFKLDSLSFFENLFKVKGKLSGNLFIKNGKVGVDVNVDKLIHKAGEIFNGKILGDSENLKVDISRAKVKDQILKNFNFLKKKDKLSLRTKLNNNSKVVLDGNFDGSKLNLSGYIKKKFNRLRIKVGEFDFNRQLYKISADMIEGRKTGSLDINVSPKQIKIVAHNFSAKGAGDLFDQLIPECYLNGDFNLLAQGNYFIGEGKYRIENLISQKSIVDINLKQSAQNLSVQTELVNSKDNLKLEFSLPLSISRNLACNVKADSELSATIKGNAHIENILELPDGVDVTGEIKSDLKISGSLGNPKIFGTLEYLNASILVSDVVLKKGNIKFTGQGNKLIVDKASFTDAYGNKAKIIGSASILNKEGSLNLITDLNINMDNFRLFDTDSMKINLSGFGKMTGPLDNMLLSGDFKVPLCELGFSESTGEDKYKDITIVNDVFFSKEKKQEKDFFKYDLNLDVPKIVIDGNIYSFRFGGKLHLGTYNHKATISGDLYLKRGRLDLFGKRMIFKKTKLEFFENHPFDPKMNLHCSRILDSMKVMLDIKNTPGKEMDLNLHSDPSYSPDIILAQMMFGKSIKELSVGEAAQLAHAIKSMSQKGYIFSLLNAFQTIGLVDSLSFSTDGNESSSLYTNSQTASGNKVNMRAGKYISDNVYISVNRKDQETSFDVDLAVGRNTSIKANSLGEVGISWKFRY